MGQDIQTFAKAAQNKSAPSCFEHHTQCSKSDVGEADFNIDNYHTVLVSVAIKKEDNVNVPTAAELTMNISQKCSKSAVEKLLKFL